MRNASIPFQIASAQVRFCETQDLARGIGKSIDEGFGITPFGLERCAIQLKALAEILRSCEAEIAQLQQDASS
jgi:hypothetical protein